MRMVPFIVLFFIPFILSEPLSWIENFRLQEECGIFQPSPVNSTRVRHHPKSMNTPLAMRSEAPYTVAIRITPLSDDEDPKNVLARSRADCTGTLISPRHVITAAHCVIGGRRCSHGQKPEIGGFFEKKIFLTSTMCIENNTHAECDSTLYVRPIKTFFPRAFVNDCPNRTAKILGDFAVVELAEDLPYSNTVHPACLNTIQPSVGTTLLMYGYGRPEALEDAGILRKLTAAVVSLEECETHDSFRGNDDEICSRHKSQMACRGDSGSGEMVIKDGRAYLTGILDYGPPCVLGMPSEEIMDFSSSTVIHNPWVAAVTGVNPGYELGEEVREQLEMEYYEYSK